MSRIGSFTRHSNAWESCPTHCCVYSQRLTWSYLMLIQSDMVFHGEFVEVF